MIPFPDERIEATLRALQAACREANIFVTGDSRISENDAARILGLHPGSLKNMRSAGEAPTSYGIGVNGSKISYRLLDVACWIERRRDVCN